MKLSMEQLSKLTKLSIPTLRVYVSRKKLGTKEGNKRVFSQSDVQKLLRDTKKAPATTKKAPVSSKKTARKARKAAPKAAPKQQAHAPETAKPKSPVSKPGTPVKTTKPSFWTRLFGGGKPKQKVSLLDAKITK
jgi:hypothetical protein